MENLMEKIKALSEIYSLDVTNSDKSLSTWKDRQSKRLKWYEVEQKLTNGIDGHVALICGEISGNFFCIDLDDKHWKGISDIFINTLININPEIARKVGINKTPSGGSHIYYLIDVVKDKELFKNKKLAIKKDTVEAGVETRGEGGYILIPPSKNYKEIQGTMSIPNTLTWDEHIFVYEFALSLNQVETTRAPSATKTHNNSNNRNDFYELSAFDQFNQSNEVPYFIEEFGWEFESQNSEFIYFTRPGKKKGISLSFTKTNNRFFMWSSSTEIPQSSSGGQDTYSPADFLGWLEKGRELDGKELYDLLVRRGYQGVKSKEFKATEIKTSDPETGELLTIELNYIETGDRGKISVNLERFKWFCEDLNLFWSDSKQSVVQVVNGCISEIDERTFQDIVYMSSITGDPDVDAENMNALEKFYKTYTTFISQRLTLLDDTLILEDNRFECWKLYKNCAVKISQYGIERLEYKELEGRLYWFSDLIQRDYVYFDWRIHSKSENRFIDYLKKAIRDFDSFQLVWGYLSHKFFTSANAYLTIFLEEVEDVADGGGSGKNLLLNLLELTSSVLTKDHAEDAKYNSAYFQSWNGEKVVAISDVPKDFKYNALKEQITGNVTIKKLWKDEATFKNAFKLVILTNYSFDSADQSMRRRIRAVEFTDFFTKAGGVDVHYNDMYFPDDWLPTDYNGFDNYTHDAIHELMKNKGKVPYLKLSDTGQLKQFIFNHGQVTSNFIVECFHEMKQIAIKQDGLITYPQLQDLFQEYAEINSVNIRYHPSVNRLITSIVDYSTIMGIGSEKSVKEYIATFDNPMRKQTFRCIRLDIEKQKEELSEFNSNNLPF